RLRRYPLARKFRAIRESEAFLAVWVTRGNNPINIKYLAPLGLDSLKGNYVLDAGWQFAE
ncbi:MAG: hypothetical protein L0177_14475, partial [Chloroflexi bacterium]|nr:hypothetical protein [Chloroflexota bacterium]